MVVPPTANGRSLRSGIYFSMNNVVNVTWHSPWHNPWHTRGTVRTKMHEALCTNLCHAKGERTRRGPTKSSGIHSFELD